MLHGFKIMIDFKTPVHAEAPVTTTHHAVTLAVAIVSRSMRVINISAKALSTHFKTCEFGAIFLAGIHAFGNRQEPFVGCVLIFHDTMHCIVPATCIVAWRGSSGRRSIGIAVGFWICAIDTYGKVTTPLFSSASHVANFGSANGIITRMPQKHPEANWRPTKACPSSRQSHLPAWILHDPCFIVTKASFVLFLLEQLASISLLLWNPLAIRRCEDGGKASSQGNKGKEGKLKSHLNF